MTDVDSELARCAIRSLGLIAQRVPVVAPDITQALVELCDLDTFHVRAMAVVVLADVVRMAGPALARQLVLPQLVRWMKKSGGMGSGGAGDDPAARAALVFLLGEYGGSVPEAPYLLEAMVAACYDGDGDGEDVGAPTGVIVKLQLLTAAMKVFFRRPPEMQTVLGKLLKRAVNDSSHQDVHGRYPLSLSLSLSFL